MQEYGLVCPLELTSLEKRERTNMSPGSDGDRVKGGWAGILRRTVRKGHTDTVTFEQSPDGSDGSRQVDSGTIASARVLRRGPWLQEQQEGQCGWSRGGGGGGRSRELSAGCRSRGRTGCD